MDERNYQVHHHGQSQSIELEDSLILQMVGQFIAPLGDIDELAINAWHAWRARRAGLDLTKVKRTSIRLKENIDRMLRQRTELLNSGDLTETDKELFRSEGNVLSDIAEIAWLQVSRIERRERRLAVSQNSFYCLDIAKNIAGATGNLVGLVSIHQDRPRLNINANILTTISGGFIVANPILSRAFGKLSASLCDKELAVWTKPAADKALAKLMGDLDAFRTLAAKAADREPEKTSNPISRMAAIEKQIRRFPERVEEEQRANQKAFTAALGGVAVASVTGSTKLATGITGIIAADRYSARPENGARLLLGGTIAYSVGTDIALIDNLKIEVMREIRYRRNRAAGTLPIQLLQGQLIKLDGIENTVMVLESK